MLHWKDQHERTFVDLFDLSSSLKTGGAWKRSVINSPKGTTNKYNVKPFQSVLHSSNKTQSLFSSCPPPPKPEVGFKHSLNTLRAAAARSATGYCAVPSVDLTSRWSGGVLWLTLKATSGFPQRLAEHTKKKLRLMQLQMEGLGLNPSAQ